MRIFKKQRIEIARKVALHFKQYYDEGKKEIGEF